MKRSTSTVGAFEAKTHLSQLLERVARGETIVITRHGKPIARLAPLEDATDRTTLDAALDELDQLSRGQSLGGLSIRELIEAGRRA